MSEGVQFFLLDALQVEEGLVDGIDLGGGTEAAERLLHPLRHIAVEGVIAGKYSHMVSLDEGLQLEVGVSHLDAESFRLIRTRNHASVVVRQNDDWLPVELRPEHPLTGDEKVVAISETVHDFGFWLLAIGY